MLCPILNDSYKGVGILVKNSVQYKNIKVEIIERERIMCLQVNFYDNIINFINVYCPNNHSEQIDFINNLYDLVISKHNLCLLGDFNHVEDSLKDKS